MLELNGWSMNTPVVFDEIAASNQTFIPKAT